MVEAFNSSTGMDNFRSSMGSRSLEHTEQGNALEEGFEDEADHEDHLCWQLLQMSITTRSEASSSPTQRQRENASDFTIEEEAYNEDACCWQLMAMQETMRREQSEERNALRHIAPARSTSEASTPIAVAPRNRDGVWGQPPQKSAVPNLPGTVPIKNATTKTVITPSLMPTSSASGGGVSKRLRKGTRKASTQNRWKQLHCPASFKTAAPKTGSTVNVFSETAARGIAAPKIASRRTAAQKKGIGTLDSSGNTIFGRGSPKGAISGNPGPETLPWDEVPALSPFIICRRSEAP